MTQFKLKIRQLDRVLAPWRRITQQFQQQHNWFQMIRETLGVSMQLLAKRMGLSPGRIAQLQQAEMNGSITLKNLRRAAESLECQLVYAFVPKESLQDTIENKAKEVAREILSSVNHTMSLEQQDIGKNSARDQYKDLVQELIAENPKNLWKDHG